MITVVAGCLSISARPRSRPRGTPNFHRRILARRDGHRRLSLRCLRWRPRPPLEHRVIRAARCRLRRRYRLLPRRLAAIVQRHGSAIRECLWLLAAVIALELLNCLFGFIKFHRMPSYHSYAAKLWGFLWPCPPSRSSPSIVDSGSSPSLSPGASCTSSRSLR